MNTIRKIFEFINRILDAGINLADETVSWTDEIVTESKMARESLAKDRAKRLEEEDKVTNS